MEQLGVNSKMTAAEVLKELKALGNPATKKMLMNNHGVQEPCFGVKIGDMKPIQKRIKTDQPLALELYDSGNYDAMYLAGFDVKNDFRPFGEDDHSDLFSPGANFGFPSDICGVLHFKDIKQ